MRFDRLLVLPSLIVILGSSWNSLRAEDTPTDLALKPKGLAKVSNVYVLEAEKPVLAKLKEARTSFASYASMSDQQMTTQQLNERSTQIDQSRNELQSQMGDLNQRISEQQASSPAQIYGGFGRTGFPGTGLDSPLVAERERVRMALVEISAEQNAIKSQIPQGNDLRAQGAKLKQSEDTFKATLADLRKQVDEVKKKYSDLDADDAIKNAVKEGKKTNNKLRLGPSDAFLVGAKELEKAEQNFLGKTKKSASAAKKPASTAKNRTKAKK